MKIRFFGKRTRCEWSYIMLGSWIGFLAGVVIATQPRILLFSIETIVMVAANAFFGAAITAGILALFHKTPLCGMFRSLFLPGVILSVVVTGIALVLQLGVAEPLLSWFIGGYVGVIIGRRYCDQCRQLDENRSTAHG